MKTEVIRPEHGRASWRMLIVLLLALPVAQASADGSFGVSIRLVRPHQPALAQALPLPRPAPVSGEDELGQHSLFPGNAQDARAYYVAEMQRLGHTLSGEESGARVSEMHWQRGNVTTTVQLQAAAGTAPTRISVRVTKDNGPNASS